MQRRFSITCIFIVPRYDLLFKFSCSINIIKQLISTGKGFKALSILCFYVNMMRWFKTAKRTCCSSLLVVYFLKKKVLLQKNLRFETAHLSSEQCVLNIKINLYHIKERKRRRNRLCAPLESSVNNLERNIYYIHSLVFLQKGKRKNMYMLPNK